MATTAQTSAATTIVTDPAHRVMGYINEARAARGLVPLRTDSRLWDVAMERAARLASNGILSHDAAGSMREDLSAQGIQWYGYGEDIGYASGRPGIAATSIFRMWAASPTHWALLMSPDYNYIGVGLVYRPSAGVTFGSVVLTESRDRTGARAAVLGAVVSGDDIRWSWRGWDPPLQTHTAGLRDFELQLRMDRGAWVTIASGTAATARSTLDNIRGHRYGLRVRATDRAGNVGSWSRERRVWLP
jgi:hypothetical protein